MYMLIHDRDTRLTKITCDHCVLSTMVWRATVSEHRSIENARDNGWAHSPQNGYCCPECRSYCGRKRIPDKKQDFEGLQELRRKYR